MRKIRAEQTETEQTSPHHISFTVQPATPGLLVAHAPPDAVAVDRCVLSKRLIAGRHPDCGLSIMDQKVSGRHFCIRRQDSEMYFEDLSSTNGSFVNGVKIEGKIRLEGVSIIRCGNSVLVYHPEIGSMLTPSPVKRYGLAGRFHTNAILATLREASEIDGHILIAGPSGTGKELAARAFAEMVSKSGPAKLTVYNAARFSSHEEATSTLFGVAPKFFSDVAPRTGLIEQADGGIIFLDELHNLPTSAQRTLLRIIEDGEISRLGETKSRRISVRFVVASNAEGETHGLANDLFARLRLIKLPSLNDRIADVPSIFKAILTSMLTNHSLSPKKVISYLSGDHFESLCMDDYALRNIRALRDLAERLTSRILTDGNPKKCVADVFGEQFKDNLLVKRSSMPMTASVDSHYVRNKQLIISTFRDLGYNVAATERSLKKAGIPCSRRWLTAFLEDWGEKP